MSHYFSNDVIELFRSKDIAFEKLIAKELESYKHKWLNTIVPKDQHQKAIDNYIFDKDGYCGYLWHVFSYEIVEHLTGDEAKMSFNKIDKHSAVLFVSIDDIAYKIKDASKINSDDLDKLYDIVITDQNFYWVYAKTHECDLGPYFSGTIVG